MDRRLDTKKLELARRLAKHFNDLGELTHVKISVEFASGPSESMEKALNKISEVATIIGSDYEIDMNTFLTSEDMVDMKLFRLALLDLATLHKWFEKGEFPTRIAAAGSLKLQTPSEG